ncbi:MAG: hypothetical protein JWQ95_6016 [Sphaerisporangium sp.]|nr:hypothetical protein [Sphaerisporangium sp.]
MQARGVLCELLLNELPDLVLVVAGPAQGDAEVDATVFDLSQFGATDLFYSSLGYSLLP